MFSDPAVVRAAEEIFEPVAFNTHDRHSAPKNEPMRRWACGLERS